MEEGFFVVQWYAIIAWVSIAITREHDMYKRGEVKVPRWCRTGGSNSIGVSSLITHVSQRFGYKGRMVWKISRIIRLTKK